VSQAGSGKLVVEATHIGFENRQIIESAEPLLVGRSRGGRPYVHSATAARHPRP
jgi:hypothetical protein